MNRDKFAVFAYWPQIATFMIITAAFIGYRYFAYYNTWSNDAYVSADIVNVAPVVSGLITKIYIKDNQAVKKGQA
ncbi:MAG TPA: secretion protein HlyD, partial [Legionellales bacterium]|nr:secretion protein HlyD [Legionellales bacterium]